MELVFSLILLVTAVFLVIAVLMQSGKSHNLSGSIAGGAETFFGKTKGKAIDKFLGKLTTIVSIVFALLVIVVYILQPTDHFDPDKWFKQNFKNESVTVTTPAEDTSAPSDEDIFDAE